MKYDVVIVGAGISGTYAAAKLSQAGLKLLLIDKEPNAHTAICGELTGSETLNRLGISKDSDLVVNKYKTASAFNLDTNFRFSVPSAKMGLCLLETEDVKKYFNEQALANGAETRFNTSVKSVVKKGEKVIGVDLGNEKVNADVVIGSDGGTGVVAATSGFDVSQYKTMPAFRYKYRNAKGLIEDDTLFIVSRKLGLGYLWVYPRGSNETNVGIGAINNPMMSQFFNSYVRNSNELKNAKIYYRGGDRIPYSGILPSIAKPGVALVGDSAGQVNPLTGGGVNSSTFAVDILIPFIIEAVEKQNPYVLLGYDEKYKATPTYKKITKIKGILTKIIKIHSNINIFDILEEVEKTVSANLLKNLAAGTFGILDGLGYLMEHPLLAYKIWRIACKLDK